MNYHVAVCCHFYTASCQQLAIGLLRHRGLISQLCHFSVCDVTCRRVTCALNNSTDVVNFCWWKQKATIPFTAYLKLLQAPALTSCYQMTRPSISQPNGNSICARIYNTEDVIWSRGVTPNAHSQTSRQQCRNANLKLMFTTTTTTSYRPLFQDKLW